MNNFEYYINEKEVAPAGQVYLGSFLAITLFFSFFFGSLLFFIIVLIISIFIFLDRTKKIGDEYGRVNIGFSHTGVNIGKEKYNNIEISSFTVHKEIFGEEDIHLRITFRGTGKQDIFIPIPSDVHLKNVYDIIYKSVKEDNDRRLSFTDQLFIKFF